MVTIEQMKLWKRMPKPHAWRPLPKEVAITDGVKRPLLWDARHDELVRATGRICVELRAPTMHLIAEKIRAKCDQYGASVVLFDQPFHGGLYRPGDPVNNADPRDFGPDHRAELSAIENAVDLVREKFNLPVSEFMPDCERFAYKTGTDESGEWNAAIDQKFNEVFSRCKAAYPGAAYVPYATGVWPDGGEHGYGKSPWGPAGRNFRYRFDYWSTPLYRPHERATTRDQLWRTRAIDENGYLWPYLSLGWGFVPAAEKFYGRIENDLRYDTGYSYCWGKEFNHSWYYQPRFSPTDRIKGVTFFGALDDPRTPTAWDHFDAYCRGAERPN